MEVIKQPNIIFISDRVSPHITFKKESLTNIELPLVSCLDLETTGLKFNVDEILLVILGDENVQYVVDYLFVDHDVLKEKMSKVSLFIGHNLSFDLPFLIERGFSFNTGQIYDTMESELSLVKGTSKSVSLQNTTERRLNFTPYDKGLTIVFTTLSKTNPHFTDSLIEYGATDILYLKQIKQVQEQFLDKFNQRELAYLNNDMTVVVSYMKVRGIKVDVSKWLALQRENERQVDQLEILMDDELNKVGLKQKKRVKRRDLQTDIFGGGTVGVNKNVNNINYSSSSQVIGVFSSLGQKIPKSAKEDKNSMGEATLQQYLINNEKTILKPFIEHLIEYKKVSKRTTSFGKDWIDKFVDSDGRVRATLKINRTATGRFSCTDPNLQQIPAVQSYRDCFVASDDYVIWGADYSGAELKILASLSKDTTMLQILGEGGDLHGYAATKVLRYLKNDDSLIVDKNNNKDFRTKMKNVIFGLIYGAGVSKIAELLDISKIKAESVYKILSETFPQAFDYLEKIAKFGVDNGYVVINDRYNQRRWFEKAFSGTFTSADKSAVERYCKNTPIQGTNGEMMKLAMSQMFNYLRSNNIDGHLLMTIHDEVLVEINKKENVEQVTSDLKNIMLTCGNYFLDGIKMEVEDYIDTKWVK